MGSSKPYFVVVLPDLPAKMGTGTRSTNQPNNVAFWVSVIWKSRTGFADSQFADSQVGWLCFFVRANEDTKIEGPT